MNRRKYLVATGSMLAIAGCIDDENDSATEDQTSSNDINGSDQTSENGSSESESIVYTNPSEIVYTIPDSLMPSPPRDYVISYASVKYLRENKEEEPILQELHQRLLDAINAEDTGSPGDLDFEEARIEYVWGFGELPIQGGADVGGAVVYSGEFDTKRVIENHSHLRDPVEEYGAFEIVEASGTSAEARWAIRDDYVISSISESIRDPINVINGDSPSTELSDSALELIERTPSDMYAFFADSQGNSSVPFEQFGKGPHIQNEELEMVYNYQTDRPDELLDQIESEDLPPTFQGTNETISLQITEGLVEHRTRIVDINNLQTGIFSGLRHQNPV